MQQCFRRFYRILISLVGCGIPIQDLSVQFSRRNAVVFQILNAVLSGKRPGILQGSHIKQGTELFPAVNALLKYRQPFGFPAFIV